MNKCRICGNFDGNNLHKVEEKMYGTWEKFEYFSCSKCYCLQIKEYPKNIEQYYPKEYYSYEKLVNQNTNFIRKLLSKHRDRGALFKKNWFEIILNKIRPNITLENIAILKIGVNHKILDVGCGAGHFLKNLYDVGLRNLNGVDPYISEELQTSDEINITKGTIFDLSEKYDLIIFNHSLEHMSDQLNVFEKIKNLLEPNGICILRIPTTSSFAWKHYVENWVQLDAPRHFYLHSINSINQLAINSNLEVFTLKYDSYSLQFYGSELYKKNISLISAMGMLNKYFSSNELSGYKVKSEKLNNEYYGDQFIVYIRKLS
jgi:2-polyprenyl-3-methyl-5-hydroxy-6-metoxy-1,4-benzoquinol methylase